MAGGPSQLLTGADPFKDQSYFLASVPGAALRDVLFPLGALRKADVRRVAVEAGIPSAHRRSSAGLCFVGGEKSARIGTIGIRSSCQSYVTNFDQLNSVHGYWRFCMAGLLCRQFMICSCIMNTIAAAVAYTWLRTGLHCHLSTVSWAADRQETAIWRVPRTVRAAPGGRVPGCRPSQAPAGALSQHDCADARAEGRHRRSS